MEEPLYEQNIPFRHDWEAVLAPVLDALVPRPDVDDEHVALIGVSQAGYWVPRAIAFEHRFAAAVADGGVIDVSAGWIKPLPEMMQKQAERRRAGRFRSRDASRGEQVADGQGDARLPCQALSVQRWLPLRPISGGRVHRLGDEVKDITTPLLITDPDDEQFFPGQPQQLYDLVPATKELIRFTAHEGANGHCEPMARSLRDTHIFDWLDGHLR